MVRPTLESGSAEMPSEKNIHPSRLILTNFLNGDLNSEQQKEFNHHVLGCLQCSQIISEARQVTSEFTQKFPTFASLDSKFGIKYSSRLRPTFVERLKGLWQIFESNICYAISPKIAWALVLFFVVGVTWIFNLKSLNTQGQSYKGQTRFTLFRNGHQVLKDTFFAEPLDTLQLIITSPEPVYYAVLYQDDTAALEIYLPELGKENLSLGNAHGEPLPHSLILDASWKNEILYCLWGSKPISLSEMTLNKLSNRIIKIDPKDLRNWMDKKNIHYQVYYLNNSLP